MGQDGLLVVRLSIFDCVRRVIWLNQNLVLIVLHQFTDGPIGANPCFLGLFVDSRIITAINGCAVLSCENPGLAQ